MVEKEIISVDYKIPKKRKYTGIIEIKAVYDDKIELELIKKSRLVQVWVGAAATRHIRL